MRHEVEAIGTNAHELPMVYAALARSDAELASAPYDVLRDWQQDYDNNLRVILPDTFGSKSFLDRAPDWLESWTGMRIDSGDPMEGAKAAIDWWVARGQDPKTKRLIFSDGLDVAEIEDLNTRFGSQAMVSFGWGTLLTNDFRGVDAGLAPFSLVCKAVSANGRAAVKLSDNVGKALGPRDEIARYKRVFALEKQSFEPLLV